MTKKDTEAIDIFHKTCRSIYVQPVSKDVEEQAKETLQHALSEDVTIPGIFTTWIKDACNAKDTEKFNYTMLLGWYLDLFDEESVKILKTVSLENWMYSSDLEDMVELIEMYGGADKVKALSLMAVQKYPELYLGDNDEYVARKAMWSLHRLYENRGSTEALEQIKKLSICGDSMVEGFAKHHLYKLGINTEE